jgi:hypothetical protein
MPEAIAAQIRNPQDRIEILRPSIEKAGGRVVAHGYLTGTPGPAVIVDFPDDLTAGVSILSVASGGAFADVTTQRLLTGEKWVQLLTATLGPAGEYISTAQVRTLIVRPDAVTYTTTATSGLIRDVTGR